MTWYEKAEQAATKISPAHTSPWKLVTAYALLSIAESLRARAPTTGTATNGHVNREVETPESNTRE